MKIKITMRPLNNHYDGYYQKKKKKKKNNQEQKISGEVWMGRIQYSSYTAGGYVMVQLL